MRLRKIKTQEREVRAQLEVLDEMILIKRAISA